METQFIVLLFAGNDGCLVDWVDSRLVDGLRGLLSIQRLSLRSDCDR